MSVNLSFGVGPRDLMLGLHDPAFAGGDFDSLAFTVRRAGAVLFSRAFVDPAAAAAFFDDRLVSMGTAGGATGWVTFDVILDLVTPRASEGMLVHLVLGTTATTPGDADHSGDVGFADLLALAKNYNQTNRTFEQGDFDGDGTVAFADLLTLAKNYGSTLNPAAAAQFGPAFQADVAAAVEQARVPEPGLVWALAPVALLLKRRRRRSRPE